jgi:hypothetical protein
MLNQIKTFKGNAIAIELTDSFTKTDVELIEQLFEEKLNAGYKHIHILVKVKDLSLLKHVDLKTFMEGEIWGIKHLDKIGRCAVVTHSDIIESVVKIESKALHLVSSALEERYFDTEQLDEALAFITPKDELSEI